MDTKRDRPACRLRRRLIVAAATLALPSGAASARMNRETHTTPLPPPLGGKAAAQELAAARRAGTIAAYDLFIARHHTHPLARTARQERRRIAARQRPTRL